MNSKSKITKLLLKENCTIKERSDSPIARVNGLSYLVLQRPDIDKAAKFFIDYGLLVDQRDHGKIYFRGKTQKNHILILEKGFNCNPRLGLSASQQDVEALANYYEKDIIDRNHSTDPLCRTLGGSYINLTDPNGIALEINHNLQQLPKLNDTQQTTPWNTSLDKPRINSTIRNSIQPRTVAKLGHCLFSVRSMMKTVHWYQDVLGMIVSDFQFLPGDPQPIVAFMRCDQGDTPSDHHTLGFGTAIELGLLHTAFEMDNFEDIAVANQWMAQRHYKHGWGIGRHILGSQIFDYWRDPYGDLFEHYADGDLFDNQVATGYHLFSDEAQHQWGPNMTAEFKGITRPGQIIKHLIKRLPNQDDLTVRRLIRMIKAV